MERELIEQYAKGADKLALAIRGLTREDLLAVPDPNANVGKWSIQQVVIHLADCDGVFADRMKRVISEENPPLMEFNENKWAEALFYQEQSGEDAAALFALTRKQMASILKKLPEPAFERFGTHSLAGKKTLADLVKTAVEHLEHHLKFIHAKRAAMGKEMW